MARKRKKKKSRGAAGEIVKRILAPLSIHKPVDMDVGAYWDALFHADERSITVFKTRRRFEMPGLFYVAGNVKIQGLGDRMVRKGSCVFVRVDVKRKGEVDVEITHPRQERVFALTNSQFLQIRQHLEPVRFRKR